MATFNKFNSFVEALAEKVHNLGSDTLKVMLTNTIPLATNTVKTDITEITPQFGYSAGGTATTITSSAQTAGTYKLIITSVVFTGAAGSFGPYQYAVLYNDTATNDELIGWWNYGSALSTNASETFTVTFDAVNGVIQNV